MLPSIHAQVFATGAVWPAPIHTPNCKQEAMTLFKNARKCVEQAENIAIIGGGAVGCELIGEIKDKFPNKKITLLHNQSLPINGRYPTKLRAKIRDQLAKMGVVMHFSERVENLEEWGGDSVAGRTRLRTVSGKTIDTDLAFVTIGNRPNTALASALDPTLVSNRGIHVLPTFQLDDYRYPYMFAIGDVADLHEMKQAFKAPLHAKTVAKNILLLIQGQRKLEAYKPLAVEPMVVPLGKKKGAGVLPMFGTGVMIGCWVTSALKGKDLFIARTRKFLGYPT